MSANCIRGGAAGPSTRLRQGLPQTTAASRRTRLGETGFTLIELMASMAILGLIMVMLFSVFEQVNKAWLNGENRVETFTQARAILDLMSRELSQAVATTTVPFYALNPKNIYFVAPVNTGNSAATDLCEIGYEFNDSVIPIPKPATLTRKFAPSTDLRWVFYTQLATWSTPLSTTFNAANDAILADGSVLSVTFTCNDINGNPLPLPYDSTTHNNKLPYSVAISMFAVDTRALARLKVLNDPTGLASPQITKSAERNFTTTVYLPNALP